MNHYQTTAFTAAIKMKQPLFNYIHPPQVDARCQHTALKEYDNSNDYVAQIKFGGTHVVIQTNGKEVVIVTTTGQRMALLESHPTINFKELAVTDNWYCFMGTILNKGLHNEKGIKERNKLVIWDVLAWDGVMLTGKTAPDRLALLPAYNNPGNPLLQKTKHSCIFVSRYYENDFDILWESIQSATLLESVILKDKRTTLRPCLNKESNNLGMIKCRKPCLLYKY